MNLRLLAISASLLTLLVVSGCGGDEDNSLSTKEVFEQARPATIEISGRRGDGASGGTGVVIDAKQGLVLTNDHVVAGLTAAKARTFNGESVAVRLVGSAPCEDIALVRMRSVPSGLTALKLGDSTKVENEDRVVALGYPQTLQGFEEQTIVSSNGTVSVPDAPSEALGPSRPRYDSTIQHTATVNPGNSGGPLLNDRGEVIGINTLGNEGGGIENQFYAITTKHIQRFLPDLRTGKKIDYAGWDLSALSTLNLPRLFELDGRTADAGRQAEELFKQKGIDGMFVWGTTTGSPAEKGNVVFGDVVTAIEDTPVRNAEDICEVLGSASPGDELRLEGSVLLSDTAEDPIGSGWTSRMTLPR